jgi:hypothetical protein
LLPFSPAVSPCPPPSSHLPPLCFGWPPWLLRFVGCRGADHPSLRFGDIVHFINMLGGHQANLVVGVEADYDVREAARPFQPMAAQVAQFTLDPRLSVAVRRHLPPTWNERAPFHRPTHRGCAGGGGARQGREPGPPAGATCRGSSHGLSPLCDSGVEDAGGLGFVERGARPHSGTAVVGAHDVFGGGHGLHRWKRACNDAGATSAGGRVWGLERGRFSHPHSSWMGCLRLQLAAQMPAAEGASIPVMAVLTVRTRW